MSVREKDLPQRVEAEIALLGMVVSAEYGDVLADAEFLHPADFYVEWRGLVWQAAQALRADGVPVNYIALVDKLTEMDALGEGKPVESISDVTECANHIPPNASARRLALSVQQAALRRQDIHRAHLLASAAYSGSEETWQHEREQVAAH
ncbi:MAG TPA: DnaB-like helicase N-terminal domain-containing protein, partial [Ktedonobacterales bacterium]|nr:DnaB-like helicase N-terminal domain-containing protein [Ktedonobacterales bacterium]